jgi:hypothetical protein
MKIVEFFGLPFSGKTAIVERIKLINNSKNFTNYRELCIFYIYKKKKISYIDYFYWLDRERKREVSHKKNYLTQQKKNTNFFKDIIKVFLPNKDILLTNIDYLFYGYEEKHKNLIIFLRHLSLKYKAPKEFKLIFDWLKFMIIGYELKKKYSNKIILNSEGFCQLLLSIITRIDINKEEIEKLINLIPKVDNLFILISKDTKLINIENYIQTKCPNFYYNKNFIKKYFFIIRCLIKKNNSKVFHYKADKKNYISKKISMILDI